MAPVTSNTTLPQSIPSLLAPHILSTLEEILNPALIATYYAAFLHMNVQDEFRSMPPLGLYRCPETDLVHFYPTLEGSPKLYEQLEAFPWYYLPEKHEFEIARRHIQPGDSVLEIGCGEGHFAAHISNAKYTGLEFNPRAVAVCHQKGLKVLHESVEEHALKRIGRYDVVCTFQVLEHIADPRAFLRQALACLRPGGLLVLSVPAADSYVSCVPNDILNLPPHHQTQWSDKALRAVADCLALDLIAIEHCPLEKIHREHYCHAMAEYMACRELGLPHRLFPPSEYARMRPLVERFEPGFRQKLLRGALPTGHDVAALYRNPGPDTSSQSVPHTSPAGPDSLPHKSSCQKITQEKQSLRIMQVATFYPAYLDHFYRTRPGLSLQSSDKQTAELLEDAFGAIHMVVPYIRTQGIDTEFVAHNAKNIQRAWAHEQGIPFPPSSHWEEEILRYRIETWKPDIVYLTDATRFDTRFFRSLTWRPRLIMGWKGADVPFSTDWTGYDAILSGLPRLLEVAERMGARRGVLFHPGMPQWIADAVAAIPQDTDVCFAGSVFPFQHDKRLVLLDGLARAATTHGFSLALHLNCHPSLVTPAMRSCLREPVFGMAMHKALRRARIVVDDRANHGIIMPDGSKKIDLGGGDTINMRMFEATGGGSLLLTEELPGLRRYFEPGREVDTYTGLAQLVEKILYYLGHEKHRATMAEAGRRRCLTEHTMDNAVQRFMAIIRELLPLSLPYLQA